MVCILVSGHPFASDSLTDGLLLITSSLVWSPLATPSPVGMVHVHVSMCIHVSAQKYVQRGWRSKADIKCLSFMKLGSLA